jgi:glycosyltransferase involved in cell wall biosynthesis
VSEIVFAIPGDIDLPTGGYAYDRHLLAQWRASGVAAQHLALPGSFPNPGIGDLAETERLLLSQPDDTVLLVDGLAFGAFPESLAAKLAGRVVALVHHPLAYETGTPPARAAALKASETAALRHASAIIVTSPATARLLQAEFDVSEHKITVAVPGVDSAARAKGGPATAPLALLAVGSLVPRKGYDVLVTALAQVKELPWALTIIGAPDRAPDTSRALREQIVATGLEGRISLAGAVDDTTVAQAYDAADLFVMPSLFEGYGMVLTEALARGLPILCTTGGAAAETAPDSAARKVAPGDAAALAKALADLIDNQAVRKQMSDAAWATAQTLPRWHDTATIVADICRKVI